MAFHYFQKCVVRAFTMCPTTIVFSAAMTREDLVFAIQLELVDSLHRCQSSIRRARPGHNVAWTNPNNHHGCNSINMFIYSPWYIYIYIVSNTKYSLISVAMHFATLLTEPANLKLNMVHWKIMSHNGRLMAIYLPASGRLYKLKILVVTGILVEDHLPLTHRIIPVVLLTEEIPLASW